MTPTAPFAAGLLAGVLAESRELRFTVYGIPEPKGSTRSFAGTTKTGATWHSTTSDNPDLRAWETRVSDGAVAARKERGLAPLEVACLVRVRFVLPRRKGHFGARGLLPSAPPYPIVKPDLDKLIRGLLDALTQAGVWRDDSLVVEVRARKDYGDQPAAHIAIEAIRNG